MRVDSRFLLWGAFGQLGKGFGIRIVLHSSKTHTHMDRVLLIKTPPPQKSEIIHYTKAVPRNTWPKCHDLTRHQARFPLSPSERFESKTWAVNLHAEGPVQGQGGGQQGQGNNDSMCMLDSRIEAQAKTGPNTGPAPQTAAGASWSSGTRKIRALRPRRRA